MEASQVPPTIVCARQNCETGFGFLADYPLEIGSMEDLRAATKGGLDPNGNHFAYIVDN